MYRLWGWPVVWQTSHHPHYYRLAVGGGRSGTVLLQRLQLAVAATAPLSRNVVDELLNAATSGRHRVEMEMPFFLLPK